MITSCVRLPVSAARDVLVAVRLFFSSFRPSFLLKSCLFTWSLALSADVFARCSCAACQSQLFTVKTLFVFLVTTAKYLIEEEDVFSRRLDTHTHACTHAWLAPLYLLNWGCVEAYV